jgi:hypothetical protein
MHPIFQRSCVSALTTRPQRRRAACLATRSTRSTRGRCRRMHGALPCCCTTSNRLVAGLSGMWFWQWLFVEALWVSDAWRGREHTCTRMDFGASMATRASSPCPPWLPFQLIGVVAQSVPEVLQQLDGGHRCADRETEPQQDRPERLGRDHRGVYLQGRGIVPAHLVEAGLPQPWLAPAEPATSCAGGWSWRWRRRPPRSAADGSVA